MNLSFSSGHSPCQQQAMSRDPKGMGTTLLLAGCQGGQARQDPSSYCQPQTPLSFPLWQPSESSAQGTVRQVRCWKLGHRGVRRGHEDRAELFLLEVSRAGTITNLQAPLLKCHPPPVPPLPGQSASRVRATRQRQGLHFASAKSQTKTPGSQAVLPPLPWRLRAQLGPARARAGHSPLLPSRGELCMRGGFG